MALFFPAKPIKYVGELGVSVKKVNYRLIWVFKQDQEHVRVPHLDFL